jgi:hypothetical protein
VTSWTASMLRLASTSKLRTWRNSKNLSKSS